MALLLFTHKIDIAADNDILAFIAPMAIAFGMQAAVSRPFGIAAITTGSPPPSPLSFGRTQLNIRVWMTLSRGYVSYGRSILRS